MKQKFFIFACLAVIFASVFSTSVYAAPQTFEGYTADVLFTGPFEYVVYKDTANDTRLLVTGLFIANDGETAEKPYVSFITNEDGSRISVLPNYKFSHASYILTDGAWVSVSSKLNQPASSSVLINSAVTSFVASSVPVTLSDGTVVFPEPPAGPTLEEIILEGVTDLQTETTQTMKTIALCGVGCLALLIGLVILPKVLYRFL